MDMSVHSNVKSFLRKNSSYIGIISMESILQSFWFYCNDLHGVSDMILEEALKQKNKEKQNENHDE